MGDCIIIGGGLSAWMATLFREKSIVISPISNPVQGIGQKRNSINKPLAKTCFDFFQINISDKLFNLKSRLILGGATTVWGGFCDRAHLSKDVLRLLALNNVDLVKLSYEKTGSKANFGDIVQLQQNTKIFNTAKVLKVNESAIVTRISPGKVYFQDIQNRVNYKLADEIILAVDSLSLLKLLYTSKILSNTDVITLFEYDYKLSLINKNSPPNKINKITYRLDRAIAHYLGLQHYHLRFFPVPFFSQEFYQRRKMVDFYFDGNFIKLQKKLTERFGNSFHCCDLRINGKKVDEILANDNIKIIGMPVVEQRYPGPISQDILQNVWEKLN